MKVFYHSSDLDGKCSGAILARKFPHAEVYSYNYYQEWCKPFDSIKEGERLIFGDIVPNEHVFEKILERTKNIVILDHHESTYDDHLRRGWSFEGELIRGGLGACLLVWKHCYSNSPVPQGVQWIAEYDDWQRTSENMAFNFGMNTFNSFPKGRVWDRVLRNDTATNKVLLRNGNVILNYLRPWYKRLVKSYAIEGELVKGIYGRECRCILLNQGAVDSSVFDSLEKKYDIYFRVTFGKSGKWNVSATTDNDDIDVTVLARHFDGGGHRNSGGFATDKIENFFIGEFR